MAGGRKCKVKFPDSAGGYQWSDPLIKADHILSLIFFVQTSFTRGDVARPDVWGDLVGYDEENCFNSPAPVSSESLTNEGFADSF